MIQEQVEVISNRVAGEGFYRMSLRSHRIASAARPGQFVHVRVSDGNDPLLRRPISIHGLDDRDAFSLLYQVKGKGTAVMTKLKPGQKVDIIGPIGNGFNIDAGAKRIILAGGGIGVAPLLFLAQKARSKSIDTTLILGARSKDCLLCAPDFKALGCDVKVMTDDGSSGTKGFVTDILEEAIVRGGRGKAVVYACGPAPMMRRAAVISGLYDIPCQVSLEERMACGIGACLGCAVMTKNGYKRVCADGPVFDAKEVEWED